MAKIVMPNCPTCGRQAILNKGGTITLLGYSLFVGDDEKVHDHDPNIFTGTFVCPQRHEWIQRVGHKCSNCEWQRNPEPRIQVPPKSREELLRRLEGKCPSKPRR